MSEFKGNNLKQILGEVHKVDMSRIKLLVETDRPKMETTFKGIGKLMTFSKPLNDKGISQVSVPLDNSLAFYAPLNNKPNSQLVARQGKPSITNELKKTLELIDEISLQKIEIKNINEKKPSSNNIFIVHGHNNEVKLAVSHLLIRLGLKDIILHDQPNQGKTIIEKLESEASKVNFAIVLLTDDDLGRSKYDPSEKLRARQNVILELGYFIGKLGRDRVIALKYGDIELPSDILGVVYETYSPNDKTWQIKIARELREAGYSIDMNKII